MAVAAAEPQYGYWPQGSVDVAHRKTPSGDTVSVEAAKAEHHQLKASEYAKKGAYSAGYPVHHLGKREADSDSQIYQYTNAYGNYPYNHNIYNAAGVYGINNVAYKTPLTYANTGLAYAAPVTTYGAYSAGYPIHHLGKREAESDSQIYQYTNAYAHYPYSHNIYNAAGVYGINNVAYKTPLTYTNTGLAYTAPVSTYGAYSAGYPIHHLGKRDADSDAQVYQYTNAYPYATNLFNTAGVYGFNNFVQNTPVTYANAGLTGYAATTPYSPLGNFWNHLY